MNFETTILYTILFTALYFEVFVLISFMDYKKKSKALQKPKTTQIYTPTVTIAVPCYNEEKTLAGTIRSLLALNYPKEKLSIIIVNDGSTDKTSAIAHAFAEQHKHITVIDKENGGKASALNRAFSQSNSEIIGCLDADSTVHKNALLHLVNHFQNKNISAVTPAIMIKNPKNILQMMQRAEYMMGIFIRKIFGTLDAIIVTPGPFSLFRASDIRKISAQNNWWKHAHGTEDFEMGLRLQSMHKKIANEPMAQVFTIAPPTLYTLYRQRIRWVYGFLMNTWDYKYMVGNKAYGNVGMFVLPTAIISIIGAIYLFMVTIINTLTYLYTQIIQIYTVGITIQIPTIELFYINTHALLFLTLILVSMVLLLLHYASQLSQTQVRTKDTLLYILLYGLIAPLWLTGATVRAMIRKESKWKVVR